MWLTDDQGSTIQGSVNVTGRQGSIEVLEFDHAIYIPTDNDTGELTGTRKHGAVTLVKMFDASSPYLFKACCNGQRLQSAVIRWYQINDSGQECEYYQHVLEGVKINSFSPSMANTKDVTLEKIPHVETVSLRYEKITHSFLDGNISYSDSWNEGR
jgi:type VI secretion system secreted protein Hcp